MQAAKFGFSFFNEHFESSEVCITKLVFFPRLLHGKAPAVRFGSNLEFWFSSIFVCNVLKFTAFTACHKPPLLNMRIVKTCRRLGSNWASPNGSQQNCGLGWIPSCSIWQQWTPGLAENGKRNGIFIETMSENCLNTRHPSSGKKNSSEMLLVLQEGLSQTPLSFWKKWYFWLCCLWSNFIFIAENKACSWIINKIWLPFPAALCAPPAGTRTGVRRGCLPQLLPSTAEEVPFLTTCMQSLKLLGSQQTAQSKHPSFILQASSFHLSPVTPLFHYSPFAHKDARAGRDKQDDSKHSGGSLWPSWASCPSCVAGVFLSWDAFNDDGVNRCMPQVDHDQFILIPWEKLCCTPYLPWLGFLICVVLIRHCMGYP